MSNSSDLSTLLKRVSTLRMWGRGGKVAPHKPLLFLYALGQFAAGKKIISFDEIDEKLGQLLRDFGGNLGSIHTEYPFWRLQNDGLWEVKADGPIATRKNSSDAKKWNCRRSMHEVNFQKTLHAYSKKQPEAIGAVADAAQFKLPREPPPGNSSGSWPDTRQLEWEGTQRYGFDEKFFERMASGAAFAATTSEWGMSRFRTQALTSNGTKLEVRTLNQMAWRFVLCIIKHSILALIS